MLHLPQTELLSRWRRHPDPGTMVALCNELAIAAEKHPGGVSADLALDVGREAEAHYPGHFEVLLAVGRLLLASGQLHRALKPLIEAARMASEPRALRFLGEVFLRLGDARHAAMAFERAVKKGGGDAETRGWLEAANGYLPLQEAHGTDYVAKELAKVQAATRANRRESVEVDDQTATHDLSFRRQLPSASEITAATRDGLPDFSEFDEDKTDTMSMSRVVAAIQHVPPAARERFLAMMNRPAGGGAAGSAAKRPTSDVDFDLDRDGLGEGEILDDHTAATRQLAASPLSSLDGDDMETQVQRGASERPPPAEELPKMSGALAAAAGRLKGLKPAPEPVMVKTGPLPAGPLPATSNRIIPVSLDGRPVDPAPLPMSPGLRDARSAAAAPPVAPAMAISGAAPRMPEPAIAFSGAGQAAAPVERVVAKTKVSAAEGSPVIASPSRAPSPYIAAPARNAPVQVVVRRPKKRKGKMGVGSIAAFAILTTLATTFVGIRMGRLPGLAQRLPAFVSGAHGSSPRPDVESGTQEARAEEPPAPAEDTRAVASPEAVDPPVDPAGDPDPPTDPPGDKPDGPSEAVASPAPPDPPKQPPPSTAPKKPPPPPKPVAKKPPPPPKDPPNEEPPKTPPPPAPDVVWLGDPELKVPD